MLFDAKHCIRVLCYFHVGGPRHVVRKLGPSDHVVFVYVAVVGGFLDDRHRIPHVVLEERSVDCGDVRRQIVRRRERRKRENEFLLWKRVNRVQLTLSNLK